MSHARLVVTRTWTAAWLLGVAAVAVGQEPLFVPNGPEVFASDLGLGDRPDGETKPANSLLQLLEEGEEKILQTQAVEPAQAVKEVVPRPRPEPLLFSPVPSGSISESPVPVAKASQGDSALSRPIVSLTIDAATTPKLESQMATLSGEFAIADPSIQKFGSWDAPIAEASQMDSRFAPETFNWAAPAVYTRPLYFEQPNLERYGHYVGLCEKDNVTQSAVSAAHFFVTVPVLPYKMGAHPPEECNYVLGAYRPGSCNPHQHLWPELSLKGLVFEGVTATGLVFLIP